MPSTVQAPSEMVDFAHVVWTHTVIGVAFVNLDGTFKSVNPAFCNLVEYTSSELVGVHFRQLTHPDDVDADLKEAERVIRGEISEYVMRKRYLTKTGRVVWIKLKVYGIRHDGELHVFFTQVGPIEQSSPPRFPGDLEMEKAERTERWRMWRWVVAAVGGMVITVVGAVINHGSLMAVGAAMLTGGVGGVAFEDRGKKR